MRSFGVEARRPERLGEPFITRAHGGPPLSAAESLLLFCLEKSGLLNLRGDRRDESERVLTSLALMSKSTRCRWPVVGSTDCFSMVRLRGRPLLLTIGFLKSR